MEAQLNAITLFAHAFVLLVINLLFDTTKDN